MGCRKKRGSGKAGALPGNVCLHLSGLLLLRYTSLSRIKVLAQH